MVTGDFTDSVRAARLKRSRLFLRHFVDVPKHLARSGEVKTALGPQLTQRGEHVMCAIDVCAHGRKAVSEAFRHETLRCEVIALVKIVFAEDVEDAGVALKTGRVQCDSVQEMCDAAEPRLRGFEGHAADQPVYFITQTQQVIGEVTAILTGNSSNQRFLRQGDPPCYRSVYVLWLCTNIDFSVQPFINHRDTE